jgi:glycosyltransferase involved in cell wall biosynthesis
MKILQTPVRLYAAGGVESYVRSLSRSLVDLGHNVSVICSDSSRDADPDQRISVKALRCAGKIANTNITPMLPLELLREDFDLMHTHIPTPWSADWSAIACMAKKKPLVLTYHNDIVGEGYAGQVAGLDNATALKLLLMRAGRILVARPRYVSARLKHCMEKVRFVPVGVNAEAFCRRRARDEGDIFFLSVLDEFHRYKGLDVLLEALKAVKAEIADVRLVVGGGGALLDNYRCQVQALGLEENVSFVGRIAKEKLADFYSGCRLFVLPSLSAEQEGFGIVPLEAMACSSPVVVTKIAGVADDVAKREAGMVVSPGDARELAKAISLILRDEQMAARMGLAGRRLIEEKYSWKRVAAQVESVYREVV